MIKQTLSAGFVAVALGLTLGSTAVFADEPMPISDTPVEPTNCLDGDPNMNCAEITSEPEPEDCIGGDGTTDCAPISGEEPIEEPGEGSSSERVDLDGDDEDDSESSAEEDEEAPLWPMYISLGALGAAVLVFIILNLFGGKKRK